MVLALKKKLAKILTNKQIGNLIRYATRGTIKRHGCRFSVRSKKIQPQIVASIFFNFYESSEIRFVQNHLRTDLPIIELGTSLGIVSCVAHLRNKNQLICVEANKDLIPLIHNNFKINHIEDYKIINAAIGYSPDRTLFFVPGKNNVSGLISEKKLNDGAKKIKTITLNSIIDLYGINDYILICDIEGAETQILNYDAKALSNCRQMIIETHKTQLNNIQFTPATLKEKILGMGFRLKDEYGPNYVFEK